MNRSTPALLLVLVAVALTGCAKSEDIFGDVGENLASPTAMAVDVASNRLYVVNSNSGVSYDWRQGNFQVLDIADPLAPVLIKSMETDSFSGEIYLDVDNAMAYVPNRYTSSLEEETDRLYAFSISEAPPESFLNYSATAVGRDSYAISCCYPDGRVWITTSLDKIQYIDLGGDMVPGDMSLLTTLSDEARIMEAQVYHMALKDNQGFLSRYSGGVMIVNLDEANVGNAVPVDYYIADVGQPRGIAVRDDVLYVVGEGNENGTWTRYLLAIDISTLTPMTDNEVTTRLDKDDDGILLSLIEVGRSPQEVLLSTDYAFVTNMDDDTVSAIDLVTREAVATIDVGEDPFSLALYTTAEGVDQYLYVGNIKSNTISIIDIPTLSVVATYP